MFFLLKYPTRQRPILFKQTFARWVSFLSGKHSYRAVVSCDADDQTMNNPEMREWMTAQPNLVFEFNSPPQTKVSAVNANMDLAGDDWQVVVLVSDDMIPMEKSYDDRIATDMLLHFPDLDGLLWYPDGLRRDLVTLSIMGRKYYDRFGFIYHPSYKVLWCDNDQHSIAAGLKRLAFIDQVIIGHAWTRYTGRDALHLKNSTQELFDQDKATYHRRRDAGFPDLNGIPMLPH